MLTPADIAKIADLMTTKSDRWWFAATAVLFVAVLLYILWYLAHFINSQMKRTEDAASRHEEQLTKITDSNQRTISDLSAVLARNTDALNGCRDALISQVNAQSNCLRMQDEFRRMSERINA